MKYSLLVKFVLQFSGKIGFVKFVLDSSDNGTSFSMKHFHVLSKERVQEN